MSSSIGFGEGEGGARRGDLGIEPRTFFRRFSYSYKIWASSFSYISQSMVEKTRMQLVNTEVA